LFSRVWQIIYRWVERYFGLVSIESPV